MAEQVDTGADIAVEARGEVVAEGEVQNDAAANAVPDSINDHRPNQLGGFDFQVHWQGFDNTTNTWLPEEEIMQMAPYLVEKYKADSGMETGADVAVAASGRNTEKNSEEEEKVEQNSKKRHLDDLAVPEHLSAAKRKRLSTPSRKGEAITFENGGKVEEIMGARVIDGILHLYVVWKGSRAASFVPAEEVNKRAPYKVIAFYESRLRLNRKETAPKANVDV